MRGPAVRSRSAANSRQTASFGARKLILAVAVLLLMFAASWYLLGTFSWSLEDAGVVLHQVERGGFVHEIIERGNVQSVESVEIKCEVRSHRAGTRILWIIPEGTYVEPAPDWKPDPVDPDEDPPDLLVKLDSSALENQRIQQQITCSGKEAEVLESKKNLEGGRMALKEYLGRWYPQEKQRIQTRIFETEEYHGRAERDLEYGETLLAKGYATGLMVQADRFAVEKTAKDWDAARTELRVLEDYTKPKTEKARLSDIEISIAAVEAREQLYQIELDKLALIEKEIENCTIRAPEAGQVVYANVPREGGRETVIEEGAVVRERQILIRLPDTTRMQVKTKIDESAVAMVHEGIPVTIRLDAFEDVELTGSVLKVNEYPEPPAWFGSIVKEYQTTIRIDPIPTDDDAGDLPVLRSGMTAEVRIRAKTIPDVIQVPVEAVLEDDRKHYCVQPDGESLRLRPVTIGSSNDQTVVIQEGLEAGEMVVMGAGSHREELSLSRASSRTAGRPLVHRVQRGEFVREITERGNVESAKNVEIKCQVQGLWDGTMVLWVIPEGTHVKPDPDWLPDPDNPDEDPPDLLVRLDASQLEERKTQQETWCKTSQAVVIRARNELEQAEMALKEYVEGRYTRQKQTIESHVFVNREYHSRAKQFLEYSETLLAKGYTTDILIQKDRFSVEKTKKDLEEVRFEERVIMDYVRPKMETSMQAAIQTGIAKLDSEEKKHQLNLKRLAFIKEQIDKCTIRAPEVGQVVYANQRRQSGQMTIIEEGTVVRERQVLIRLPDPTTMQVKAKINEASVTRVREGMPARIRLDAFEGVELTGSVLKVNEYPAVAAFGSAVREYETTIGIDQLPKDEASQPLGLRPGMTAEVRVRVETLSDVIQVPVQAILEHDGNYHCVLPDGETVRPRKLTVGSSNGKTAVITEGLEAGDQIILEAASYRGKLDPLLFPPQTPDRTTATSPARTSPKRQPVKP